MTLCDFHEVSRDGERVSLQCKRCRQVVRLRNPGIVRARCGGIKCSVGTALKSLLATIGITAAPNCSCQRHAAEMDARGCDWCEANIDTIVGWLREEATKRGLPFLDAAGRLLVRRAIHNARRAAAN